MKTTIYKICFIISSFLLIQSCSVEKRTFRSGYYIEWNQRSHRNSYDDGQESKIDLQLENNHQQMQKLTQIQSKEMVWDEIKHQQLDSTAEVIHAIVKSNKTDHLLSNRTFKSYTSQHSEKLKKKILKLAKTDHKKNDSVETEKKLNSWSLISFIFGCLTFLLGALSLAQLPELLVVAFIFSIFAYIAGKISWKQQKSTDNYNRTSKVFSILGMILSFTPLLFGLVLLIISIGNFFSFIKIF